MLGLFKKSDKAIDPVCLMKVSQDKTSKSYEYKGKIYYFCSAGCCEEFIKNPQKYKD